MINVEVAYATGQYVDCLPVVVTEGTTVIEAIAQSGIQELHPGICIDEGYLGILGRHCRQDSTLRDGDRIEIYRPLLADPKEARRRRAARRDDTAR